MKMKPLMMVSARADARLRAEVADRRRPCPEYLRLEGGHGFDLLDWSRFGAMSSGRSVPRSLKQAWLAARLSHRYSVVLSDGEPVGIPFAVARSAVVRRIGHVMIVHRLTHSRKRTLFKLLRAGTGVDRILVHSSVQRDAVQTLRMGTSRVAMVDYAVDSEFWTPGCSAQGRLVVSAGRDHRDFATLATACANLRVDVFVTGASAHSPDASARMPRIWPSNFSTGRPDYVSLRDLYSRAAVVVVPMLECDFQAGITALLEGMAMGKAVVVTATRGLRDVLDEDVCLAVPPGDASAMLEAIQTLLSDPALRRRIGEAGREAVERRYHLDAYCSALARHTEEVSCASC